MKKLNFLALVLSALLVSGNVWAGNQAKIVGGNEYATLQLAVDAASNDQTIQLLENITVSNTKVANIANGKDIILDLNGFTIDETTNTDIHCIFVEQGAKLTVEDSSNPSTGKIVCRDTRTNAWVAIACNIAAYGSVTIKGGTILNETDVKAFTYPIESIDNFDATVTINGGLVKAKGPTAGYINPAIRLYINNAGSVDNAKTKTFVMTGGEVIGQRGVYSQMGYWGTGLTAEISGGHLAGYNVTEDQPERAFDSQLYGNGTSGSCTYKNVTIRIYKDGDKQVPRISGYVYCGDMDAHEYVTGSENIKIEGGIFDMHHGLRSAHQASDFDNTATGDDIWKTNRMIGSVSGGEFFFDKTKLSETMIVQQVQFAKDNGTSCAACADGHTFFYNELANKEGWEALGFTVVPILTPTGKEGNWYKIVEYTPATEDYSTFLTYIKSGYMARVKNEDVNGKTVEIVPIESKSPTTAETTAAWNNPTTWGGSIPSDNSQVSINAKIITIGSNETPVNAIAYSLSTSNDGKVIVKAGSSLTIGVGGAGNAAIEVEKNGILKIDPDAPYDSENPNTLPTITADLYTTAHTADGISYWQFFAKPTNIAPDHFSAVDAPQGTVHSIYGWNAQTKEYVALQSKTDLLKSFAGFAISNTSAAGGITYRFQGKYNPNKNGKLEFAQKGFCLMGNSYLAPVSLKEMFKYLASTSSVQQTIWYYESNSGSFKAVTAFKSRKENSQLQPMEGFFMYLMGDEITETINGEIDYTNAVWKNTASAGPIPAPARNPELEDLTMAQIIVSANGHSDVVDVMEDAQFSTEFDNGVDATKLMNPSGMFNLYSSDNLASVATNELDGVKLNFQSNAATTYTMSFNEVAGASFAIFDKETNVYTMIDADHTYTFQAQPNTTYKERFCVVASRKVPTLTEMVEVNNAAKGIYTIMGQYLGSDWSILPAGVYVVDGQKVVK